MEKAQLMATLGLTLEDLPAAMKRLEEGIKQDEEEEKRFLSRPKDRTLEAYKAWMTEIIDRMLPSDNPRVMTDQDWEDGWKIFWSDVDSEAK